MKHLFTCLTILVFSLLYLPTAQAQETLNPSRVRWSTPLSSSAVKTVVDASGASWVLSGANTFQVIDPQGSVRWTKKLSALTVADFAIDTQGQVLLVGLPASGQPVLEKYDANQTFVWRNVLDSLSNAAGQADNLSVSITSAGGGLVLGINAQSTSKLSYYTFGADGKLRQPGSLQPTTNKTWPVTPIKPIVYNTDDMLLGLYQRDSLNTLPVLYRLKKDAATILLEDTYQNGLPFIESYAFNSAYLPGVKFKKTIQPLLTDGTKAYLVATATYDAQGTPPGSATEVTGYYAKVYPVNPSFILSSPGEAGTTDLKLISEAMGKLIDSQGYLYTTQVVNNTATGAATSSLLLNQYVIESGSYKTFTLIKSVKIGTTSATTSSQNSQRLVVLKHTNDGLLLLSGTTSGTMTIGKNTFVGTEQVPAQFLLTISPEEPAQTLSAEQVSWTNPLPAIVRKVVANARKQSWVQLPDSTFRYYNSTGKLIWEKKINTNRIYDFGGDLAGNLYVMGLDTLSMLDSTGLLRWKLFYRQADIDNNADYLPRILYVKPGGGGLVAWISPWAGYQWLTEFDQMGKQTTAARTTQKLGTIRDVYFLANVLPRSNTEYVLVIINNQLTYPRHSTFLTKYTAGNATLSYNGDLPASNLSGMYTNPPASFHFPIVPIPKWVSTEPALVATSGDHSTYMATQYDYDDSGSRYFVAYGFSKFDSTGKAVFTEINTPRVNTIALAKSTAVNSAGTLFAVTINPRLETTTSTSYDLRLNQYSSTLESQVTTRLGTFTLASGQANNTTLSIVKAYADGSLLVSGSTNGTLTIGANSYIGNTATPARFLTLINTVITQVTAPATAVCASSTIPVTVRYKGYLTQIPVINIYAAGSLIQSARLPFNSLAVADTTITINLPFSDSAPAGIYQIQTAVGSITSNWASLSITAKPAALTVKQIGDELVSSTATVGTYQWYDAQNKPVSGATDTRFKPQTSGSYYVVATANGCSSAPSASISYVITATEPTVGVELYPNPAADRLLVRWPGAGANARIRLLTAQGRVVQDVPRQGELTNVPTQGLADGLVLVQLQAEGQTTLVRKVLIQR